MDREGNTITTPAPQIQESGAANVENRQVAIYMRSANGQTDRQNPEIETPTER